VIPGEASATSGQIACCSDRFPDDLRNRFVVDFRLLVV